MGRYPALWEVDRNKIPIDPKERGNIRRIKGALYRPETDFSHNMRINLINVELNRSRGSYMKQC
jgi:hypothetical protein